MEFFCFRGGNFRTTYSRVGSLRALTSATFVALTASAPLEVEAEIISSLFLNNPVKVYRPLDRPNIFLSSAKSFSLSVS